MMTPKEIWNALHSKFDHNKILDYLKDSVKRAGIKTVYAGLLLYYAYNRSDTPTWARRMILGTLAYLVAPFDAVPDLTPFFGFTDDFGILMFGLVSIAGHINQDVRVSAREKIEKWFGPECDDSLEEVEESLNV